MFPSFFVFGFVGLIQFRYSLVFSCPPNDSEGGAKTVKFCSDSEVTSSNIYIDSSDASNRVTNCTCNFNVSVQTQVTINTTSNHYYNCITKIMYGDKKSGLFNVCGNLNAEIDSIKTSQTYELVLINGKINLKNYCLHLFTGNRTKIKLKCFQDIYLSTTSPTSAEPISTRPATSVETLGLPKYMLGPVAGAVIIEAIIVMILAIVCNRRKRKDSKSCQKTDPRGTLNQAAVYEDRNSGNEIRDDDQYNSIKFHSQIEDRAGGYEKLEINRFGDTYTKLQKISVDFGGGYAEAESPKQASDSKTTTLHIQD